MPLYVVLAVIMVALVHRTAQRPASSLRPVFFYAPACRLMLGNRFRFISFWSWFELSIGSSGSGNACPLSLSEGDGLLLEALLPFALLVITAAVYVVWAWRHEYSRKHGGHSDGLPEVALSSTAFRGAAERLLGTGETPTALVSMQFEQRIASGGAVARDANGTVPIAADAELALEETNAEPAGGEARKPSIYSTAIGGMLLDLRPLVRTTQALLLYSCERSGAGRDNRACLNVRAQARL